MVSLQASETFFTTEPTTLASLLLHKAPRRAGCWIGGKIAVFAKDSARAVAVSSWIKNGSISCLACLRELEFAGILAATWLTGTSMNEVSSRTWGITGSTTVCRFASFISVASRWMILQCFRKTPIGLHGRTAQT